MLWDRACGSESEDEEEGDDLFAFSGNVESKESDFLDPGYKR